MESQFEASELPASNTQQQQQNGYHSSPQLQASAVPVQDANSSYNPRQTNVAVITSDSPASSILSPPRIVDSPQHFYDSPEHSSHGSPKMSYDDTSSISSFKSDDSRGFNQYAVAGGGYRFSPSQTTPEHQRYNQQDERSLSSDDEDYNRSFLRSNIHHLSGRGFSSPHVSGRLQLKLSYAKEASSLYVTIIAAEGIIPKENGGLRNPYAKIYLLPDRSLQSKRRTKTALRTLSPKWNLTFMYSIKHPKLHERSIEFTIWDYDRLEPNEFLGEVVIDMHDACLDGLAHWYPLNIHNYETPLPSPTPMTSPRGSFRDKSKGPMSSSSHSRSDQSDSDTDINRNIPRQNMDIYRTHVSPGILSEVDHQSDIDSHASSNLSVQNLRYHNKQGASNVVDNSGNMTPRRGSLNSIGTPVYSPANGSAHSSPVHSSGRRPDYLDSGGQADHISRSPLSASSSLNSSKGERYAPQSLQQQGVQRQNNKITSSSSSSDELTSSSKMETTTTALVSQTTDAVKPGSFLQRATKFFQQQFQLDGKPQGGSEKTPSSATQVTETSQTATTTAESSTVSTANRQALSNTVSGSTSTVNQAQNTSQSGVSPYRQMPVITRDQISGSGYQIAPSQQQQRQAQTQQYLQPPNYRMQRKVSEPKMQAGRSGSSSNESSSPNSIQRRASAGSKSNRGGFPASTGISPGEYGRSSPNVTRKQRLLPNVAGRQPLDENEKADAIRRHLNDYAISSPRLATVINDNRDFRTSSDGSHRDGGIKRNTGDARPRSNSSDCIKVPGGVMTTRSGQNLKNYGRAHSSQSLLYQDSMNHFGQQAIAGRSQVDGSGAGVYSNYDPSIDPNYRRRRKDSYSSGRSSPTSSVTSELSTRSGSSSSLASSLTLTSFEGSSPWVPTNLRKMGDAQFTDFVEGLGPAQMVGRQVLGSPHMGDIQISLFDRRGLIEIEIIRARGLLRKPGSKTLPAPYVKVYLMDGKKCLAKKKTKTARKTLEPHYQQQLEFHASPRGKTLQVMIWGDYGKLDRKVFMGVCQILLDDLDLSQLVIGWYKLFTTASVCDPPSSMDSMAATRMTNEREETNY
eukprot:gene11864-13098_t